jgi:alginate biosynthesis protein Alg44
MSYPTHPKQPPSVSGAVHESASQRHHPRVRLPGAVEFGSRNARYRLYDVSSGGFCFETNGQGFRPGDCFRGNLALQGNGVAVTLSVPFQIRNVDRQSGRAGCSFQELGQHESAMLRNLITGHLAGDAGGGDAAPPGREQHFNRGRTGAVPSALTRLRPPAQGGGGRFRALVTTALFLGAAVVAFGYTARQVNRVVFASTATAAKVAGPVYTVAMPREGTFYSLVPDDGMIKKGAPIASFEAPVLDLVRNQSLGANLTPEQLQKLMKVTVKGTITSPCDCKVQNQFVANGQYVAREQPLFELTPRDFEPYLVARFRNDQLDDLSQGDKVSFRVSGDEHARLGKIVQVRAHGEGDTVDSDVMVMIAPDEPLPPELLSRPAEVVAGGFPLLPDVVTGLTATARDRLND